MVPPKDMEWWATHHRHRYHHPPSLFVFWPATTLPLLQVVHIITTFPQYSSLVQLQLILH